MRWFWIGAAIVAGMFCLILATIAGSGYLLARPAAAIVGPPPQVSAVEEVEIRSTSGSILRGWMAPGRPRAGAVILMHGVRSNRSSLAARMRLLHDTGFSVLAFDFQAHGESPGERITFGHLESLDARSALAFLRERLPRERVGAIGISLGGASALLGAEPLRVDALVIESVYPDIESAIANRLALRIGGAGRLVAPIYVLMMNAVIGVPPIELRPIDRIDAVSAPLLFVSGTEDQHTSIAETRRMFHRAPQPKELWEVSGAGHVDLLRFAPHEYESRVVGFLKRHLNGS